MKTRRIFSNRNIIILITIAFMVWVIFFDRNNYLNSIALDKRIEELETERLYFIDKIQEDSLILAGLDDSAFLVRYAREIFRMHDEHEEIYIIPESQSLLSPQSPKR